MAEALVRLSPHQTRQYTFGPCARHEGAAALPSFREPSKSASRVVIIKPSIPSSIKQRRYWNAPHGSALALALAETGRAHAGLVVAVARDTHAAHALENELAAFA